MTKFLRKLTNYCSKLEIIDILQRRCCNFDKPGTAGYAENLRNHKPIRDL